MYPHYLIKFAVFLSDGDLKTIVDSHNYWRGHISPTAANMKKMVTLESCLSATTSCSVAEIQPDAGKVCSELSQPTPGLPIGAQSQQQQNVIWREFILH